MQYDGLAWFIALLALVAIAGSVRTLAKRGWLLGWLRGTGGLLLLVLAVFLCLMACDLQGYSALPENKPLVTVSFEPDGPQHYKVVLLEGGDERRFELEGDLWQLDARVLQWKGLPALIGIRSGYRLQTISGRYRGLEQQTLAQHLEVVLARSPGGVDLWKWLRDSHRDLYLFDPQPARVSYLPMAPDAVFAVSWTSTGLVALPVNQAAAQAMQNW